MIIGIINHKGGVGKTTTSINLSSGLAGNKKKTLIIDIDPQGNTTVGLDCKTTNDQPTIKDILEEDHKIEQVICNTQIKNLNLIPSNMKLSFSAERLYSKVYKEAILQKALKPVLNKYEYIVIDSPPNLGVLTINTIYVSDLIIIPCETSRAALDGIDDLLNTIEMIKGNDFTNYRILLTKFDSRTKSTNEIVFKELEPYKEKMFNTIIHRTEALNQAQFAKESVFDYEKKSKGAINYQELTTEVIKNYE